MTSKLADNLKYGVQRSFPAPYRAARSLWRCLLEVPIPDRAWRVERRLERIARAIRARYGESVRGGPFAGMVYVPQAIGSVLAPKLLGCYEIELADVIERVVHTGYATILNVGSAEGYYAVGLALRMPGTRVYAFDGDPRAQALCQEMARINGVGDRVLVRGSCDVECLRHLSLERALLICDCEGYEIDLLQPGEVPGLQQCDLLVELHDSRDRQITPVLLSRFQETHEITLYDSTARDPAQFPLAHFLRPAARKLAVCEFRSPQQWAFMVRRCTGPGLTANAPA